MICIKKCVISKVVVLFLLPHMYVIDIVEGEGSRSVYHPPLIHHNVSTGPSASYTLRYSRYRKRKRRRINSSVCNVVLALVMVNNRTVIDVLDASRCGLDERQMSLVERSTSTDYATSIIKACVTGQDVDAQYNYEFFEFIGDAIINRHIIEYIIYNKYENLSHTSHNVGILTKLRSVFVSKRNLCVCSARLKLHRHCYTTRSIDKRQINDLENYESNSTSTFDEPVHSLHVDVESLMEDLMESFVGGLWYCLHVHGEASMKDINDILRKFIWTVVGDGAGHVDTNYERLNSARDRLQIAAKELYPDRIKSHVWHNKKMNIFTCRVTMDNDTRIVSQASSSRARDAVYDASMAAMRAMPELASYVPATSIVKTTRDVVDDNYDTNTRLLDEKRFDVINIIMKESSYGPSAIEDLDLIEIHKMRSAFSDHINNSDFNCNIGHFKADALMKYIVNTYVMLKYPHLRTSSGIRVIQSVNEKFRTQRSFMCALMGMLNCANISHETASQRVPVENVQASIFDAVVFCAYEMVEYRSPGAGDDMLLNFIDKCFQCMNLRIKYEYLVSPQLRLLNLAKHNNYTIEYLIKARGECNSSSPCNYREGTLMMTGGSRKVVIETTRAIDEKALKTALAVKGMDYMRYKLGIQERVPEAFSVNVSREDVLSHW